MFEFSDSYIKNRIDTRKITAVWAFSETALGGILHALQIPLTGLFIGSAAVLFISLLAQYGKSKPEILKATMIVIIVKAVVTPYVPLNSYLAVTIQGILGFIFFSLIPSKRVAAVLFGASALFFAALQRLIMMTILFGATIWNSLDTFVKFILDQIPILNVQISFSASFFLIAVYTVIHIVAGMYVGLRSTRFEIWLVQKFNTLNILQMATQEQNNLFQKPKSGKRKKWWQRVSGIVIIAISVCVMIISYVFPQLSKSSIYDITFMLVRSFMITFLWFVFISPLIMKAFKLFVEKQQYEHSAEVTFIANLFPSFKSKVNYCWRLSTDVKGINRYRKFLSDSLALLFLSDL